MTITVARQAPGLPVGLKLVIVLVLSAGVAGWLEPRLFREPVDVIGGLLQRVKLDLGTTEVPDLHGDIMAIEHGADGAVWVATKQDVVRYASGDVDDAGQLLNPGIYRDLFRRRMDALSALHVAPDGEAWVGSWYGQVLRYRSGGWRLVSDRETPPTGRIRGIVKLGGATYVGGQGLWVWSSSRDTLREVEDFPGRGVTALARGAAGELVVGTREGVLARRAGSWQTLWRTGRDDVEVNALFVTRDGQLLVATHDGYVVVDAAGQVLYRELAGRWVTGFTESAHGELWVATWKSGVHVRGNGSWRRVGYTQGLADDSLSAVLADGRGRLWLGIYGHGVSVAEAGPLKAFAAGDGGRPTISGAQVFADACGAAAELLGARAESGRVAVDTIAGRATVFFNGRQACPAGVGYRRAAGTLVTIADNTVHLTLNGDHSLLPLPARGVAARPSAAFIDSRDRLWLGFRGRGLFVLEDGRWQAFGRPARLTGNPVQAIAEDTSGGIWVATYPPFDRASRTHLLSGVHLYDGESWTHFRPPPNLKSSAGGTRRGLAAVTANNVRVLPDGRVAIATNGGLSIYDDGSFNSFVRSRVGGLPSNFVADVIEGPNGHLWMTHSLWGHGVTWQRGFLFRNKNSRDGLFHDRIKHIAFDAKGNVWMQSSYGEAAVYPLASLVE
jgi:ligand-binding sensor domain-containing protein